MKQIILRPPLAAFFALVLLVPVLGCGPLSQFEENSDKTTFPTWVDSIYRMEAVRPESAVLEGIIPGVKDPWKSVGQGVIWGPSCDRFATVGHVLETFAEQDWLAWQEQPSMRTSSTGRGGRLSLRKKGEIEHYRLRDFYRMHPLRSEFPSAVVTEGNDIAIAHLDRPAQTPGSCPPTLLPMKRRKLVPGLEGQLIAHALHPGSAPNGKIGEPTAFAMTLQAILEGPGASWYRPNTTLRGDDGHETNEVGHGYSGSPFCIMVRGGNCLLAGLLATVSVSQNHVSACPRSATNPQNASSKVARTTRRVQRAYLDLSTRVAVASLSGPSFLEGARSWSVDYGQLGQPVVHSWLEGIEERWRVSVPTLPHTTHHVSCSVSSFQPSVDSVPVLLAELELDLLWDSGMREVALASQAAWMTGASAPEGEKKLRWVLERNWIGTSESKRWSTIDLFSDALLRQRHQENLKKKQTLFKRAFLSFDESNIPEDESQFSYTLRIEEGSAERPAPQLTLEVTGPRTRRIAATRWAPDKDCDLLLSPVE